MSPLCSGPIATGPTAEVLALAALEDSERTLAAYQKALEGATADLAAFTAKHRGELYADILETLERFFEEFGELPPAGYFRRLWWWPRGGEG